MLIRKYFFVLLTCLVLFSFILIGYSSENDFPTRPIEFVTTTSAGGGTDIMARMVSKAMEPILGVNVQVVNKPGGTGTVALSYVEKQPSDGHTIFNITNSTVGNSVKEETPVHWRDMGLIALVQVDPRWMVVNTDSEIKDFYDLIDYSEDNSVRIAGYGVHTDDHLPVWYMGRNNSNIQYVPFDSTSEALSALLGNHVDVLMGSLVSFLPQIESKEVRALAVFHDDRVEAFPDVPTGFEVGIPMSSASLRGIGCLGDVPAERIEILQDTIKKAVQDPEYQQYVKESYLDIVPNIYVGEDFHKVLEQYEQLYIEFFEEEGII
jgi:putative tricarboxylic transport membrane protein